MIRVQDVLRLVAGWVAARLVAGGRGPAVTPVLAGVFALTLVVATPSSAPALGVSERPEMVTAETERAIQRGLAYLARTQGRDGTWTSDSRYGRRYPTAMTALAGLALMGAGNTPIEGEYAPNVRRAVDALVRSSNANGLIAQLQYERSVMHGHGFAMMFLAEAYGMDRDPERRRKIRDVLKRAITLTGRSQSDRGGWLYTPDSGGDEGSVTVTQIQGLRACRNAGVYVPRKIVDGAVQYIADSAQPDGGIAYRVGMRGSRPPITAAAVATLYNAGNYDDPMAERALVFIDGQVNRTNNGFLASGGHEYYGMFYTAQAMYFSGDERWRDYYPKLRDELLRRQRPDGSWNGDHVGGVYGAALALVALQLPYGYLPIFQR